MIQRSIAALVLALSLVACSGAEGEPLVSGVLTGSYDGTEFTATNGFAAMEDGVPIIVFGSGNVRCGSQNAGSPPSGRTAAFRVPSLEVGTYGNVIVQMYENVNGFEGVGSNGGSVTISAVTTDTISGTVGYTYTDTMSRMFSFSGTFEVVNCP
jgi:hypothetical protein